MILNHVQQKVFEDFAFSKDLILSEESYNNRLCLALSSKNKSALDGESLVEVKSFFNSLINICDLQITDSSNSDLNEDSRAINFTIYQVYEELRFDFEESYGWVGRDVLFAEAVSGLRHEDINRALLINGKLLFPTISPYEGKEL